MKKNKLLPEWEETINDMSYEELKRCIADSNYYPEYLEYAKFRLAQLEIDMAHVYEVFIKTLKKRRIKYELESDNEFFFTYNRKRFKADLDCELDCVMIMFLHDIHVDKENTAKVLRLKEAVNWTNIICNVNTFYDENKSTGNIIVASHSSLNYITQNPNFETELIENLNGYFFADSMVKALMKRKYNKRKKLEEY